MDNMTGTSRRAMLAASPLAALALGEQVTGARAKPGKSAKKGKKKAKAPLVAANARITLAQLGGSPVNQLFIYTIETRGFDLRGDGLDDFSTTFSVTVPVEKLSAGTIVRALQQDIAGELGIPSSQKGRILVLLY